MTHRPRVYDSGSKPPTRQWARPLRKAPAHMRELRSSDSTLRNISLTAQKTHASEALDRKLDQLLGKPENTPISWLSEPVDLSVESEAAE